MTQDEYNEAAALVVRLRKELEHTNQHLVAHIDALTKSNAQCADYHKRIELLAQELHETAAERHRLQLDCDAMQMKIAACDGVINDRDQLHSELVEVRAALASVSEERDSLKRTLKAWEEAETKPHVRVTADDVADHVVPPVLPLCNVCHECGSELANCSQGTNHHDCPRPLCPRTCTGRHGGGFSPYSGPCKSATPVRHE